ncbi:MAG: hypothetical protein OSA38_02755 [Candidatus Poseidoniaceae archaeon]|nr:hypothetical protein [Candidatus Poseidoniaceae archaeon]
MEPSEWDETYTKKGEQTPDSVNLQDSVVGGNVHTGDVVDHHPQPIIMGQTENIFGGHQPPIMIHQNPSSAPKVIGILVMIYAVFGLFDLISFANPVFWKSPMPLIAASVLGLMFSACLGVGGFMIMNYQRQGVMLALSMLLLLAIVGLVEINAVVDVDFYDEMLESGEITQEEYDAVSVIDAGLISTIGSIMVVVCNAMCMGIVAIPLMVANNGLDQSKIFG